MGIVKNYLIHFVVRSRYHILFRVHPTKYMSDCGTAEFHKMVYKNNIIEYIHDHKNASLSKQGLQTPFSK